MLEWIKVRNFQIWKKLFLRFDEDSITCIVGKTDHGKSTIIRVLRWVFLNEPDGTDFFSWGTDFCKVTIGIDGHVITRQKGKGTNLYILDGKEFKAFKSGVPEEIQQILKVDSINFQLQLDSPFWFLQSPGMVSRELNRIIDLSIMDLSLSNISSDVRAARSIVTVSESRLSSLLKQKKTLRWIRKADTKLKVIESIQEQINTDEEQYTDLYGVLLKLRQLKKKKKLIRKAVENGEGIIVLVNQVQDDETQQDVLRNLIKKLKKADKFLTTPIPDFKPIEEAKQDYDRVAESFTKLQLLVQRAQTVGEELCQAKESAIDAEKKFHLLMKGKPCPLCGQRVE